MLFNSIEYVIFLPLVVIFYYLIPARIRWVLLLLASYYFYMSWKAEYLILILVSTAIDYFAGLQMGKIAEQKKRRPYLILSLASNLGILFAFKYFNFFSDSARYVFDQFNIFYNVPVFDVLLPVGISFYTFQTLSYSIEVYWGRQKPEKHLGYFALYVSFFPQLVAGPIERFDRLGPQLRQHHLLTYNNIVNGLKLIVYGLFIKMVIADNLSVYVDKIFEAPAQFSSSSILSGLFFYSFQIYSDFYGYSTIAIGSALLLGVNLMDNFRAPYLSKSITEFWSRWHISLSTWFRDYLYIPLGGNRVKISRWYLNILIVFLVSGLWHGASWTFVIWGGLHGAFYLGETFVNKSIHFKSSKGFNFLNVLLVLKNFTLVTLIWVFFRSQSFGEAITVFDSIISNTGVGTVLEIPPRIWLLLLFFIITDVLLYNTRFDKWINKRNMVVRWSVYAVLIILTVTLSGVDNQPFIYFQF
jgi:D-alanyl-lipoteichoic acid acyltransferase DltB (MBOAT superfamily)